MEKTTLDEVVVPVLSDNETVPLPEELIDAVPNCQS
jgi:hypothetical protein